MKDNKQYLLALVAIVAVVGMVLGVGSSQMQSNGEASVLQDASEQKCFADCMKTPIFNKKGCEKVEFCRSSCSLPAIDGMCGGGGGGAGNRLCDVPTCPLDRQVACGLGNTSVNVSLVQCVTSSECAQLGGIAHGVDAGGNICVDEAGCIGEGEDICFVPDITGSRWICLPDTCL